MCSDYMVLHCYGTVTDVWHEVVLSPCNFLSKLSFLSIRVAWVFEHLAIFTCQTWPRPVHSYHLFPTSISRRRVF
jgi:hypothetical protein